MQAIRDGCRPYFDVESRPPSASISPAARAYDPVTFGRLAFATAGGLLLGALAVLWHRVPRGPRLNASWARWLGAIPIAAAMASIHVRGISSPGPLLTFGVIAAAGVVVMIVGTATNRPPVLLAGALASGVALRVFEFEGRTDRACRGICFRSSCSRSRTRWGESPYRVYQLPWEVPLTYMPLNWLAYAPLLVAGADPRWTNALAELAVLGALISPLGSAGTRRCATRP